MTASRLGATLCCVALAMVATPNAPDAAVQQRTAVSTPQKRDPVSKPQKDPANDLQVWLVGIDGQPVGGVQMFVHCADQDSVAASELSAGTYFVKNAGRKVQIDIPARQQPSGKDSSVHGVELKLKNAEVNYVMIQMEPDTGYIRHIAIKSEPPGTSPGSQQFGSAPALAASDDCLSAELIACNGSVTFDNTFNTTDPSDPDFSCHFGAPAQGVGTTWFKFVATDTTAVLDTNLSAVSDTLLAVYDGACGSLVEIACSEDDGDGLLSEVCVSGLTVGAEYLVQVASFSEFSLGEITLTLTCPGPCGVTDNDECAGAQTVDCNGSVTFDNSGNTTAPDDPDFSCHFGGPAQGVGTTWFKFVATATAAFLDTNQSSVSDTLLAVYDGSCGSLVEIGCSEDEGDGLLSELCVEDLVVGNEYYVQVASFSESSLGEITLSIACPGPCVAASNDECAGAEVIDCNGSITFDNSANTTSPDDPPFGCHFGGPDQGVGTTWFRFVAAADSALLDTNQSLVSDTLLAVYDGSCGSLVELACSEDEGDGLLSEVCVEGLVIGNEYYVQVASFSESSLGEITLSLACPCPVAPANDDCTQAEDVGTLPATVFVDNTFATDDIVPGEECGVFSGPFANVWYTVTGTGNTMTATTCNEGTLNGDTKISVFCGDCLERLCVTGNDDDCPAGGPGFSSTASWCSQAGVTYFITVGNFGSSGGGLIQLDVFDDGVPCTDGVQCLPTGACCLPDGSCIETSSGDCALQGGVYQGDGVPCFGEAVVDGSFEAGAFGGTWIEASTNFGTPLCSLSSCGAGGGTGPRTGDFWSWFGGVAAAETGSVEQDVVIPAGARTLDFWLEIPVTSGNGVDFLSVMIDGMEIFNVLESAGPFLGYTLVSIPLGGLADGGVHALRFESTITGSGPLGGGFTNFFVDDVSIASNTGVCAPDCVVIDFELDVAGAPIANGEELTTQYAGLVTLSGTGSENFGVAAFDSTPGGPNTSDPDLLVDLGNVMILQEHWAQTNPPIFDYPDDANGGGTMVFDFAGPVEVRGLDLIDVDLPQPVQDVVVTLIDGTGNARVYDVPQGWTEDIVLDGPPGFRTLDTTTLAPQPGLSSVATASEDPGFDPSGVVRMEVFCSSSAAVDNVEVCPLN